MRWRFRMTHALLPAPACLGETNDDTERPRILPAFAGIQAPPFWQCSRAVIARSSMGYPVEARAMVNRVMVALE